MSANCMIPANRRSNLAKEGGPVISCKGQTLALPGLKGSRFQVFGIASLHFPLVVGRGQMGTSHEVCVSLLPRGAELWPVWQELGETEAVQQTDGLSSPPLTRGLLGR